MIEIGGKPILRHNIEMLGRAGVRQAVINLHYFPERICEYFGDAFAGVALSYSYEPQLLGTAGAARNCAAFLRDGDFIVAYGDNLSTIDLRKLVALHRERDADVTLAVFHRDDVAASGIVELDADDRVTRFLEKPREDEIRSEEHTSELQSQ